MRPEYSITPTRESPSPPRFPIVLIVAAVLGALTWHSSAEAQTRQPRVIPSSLTISAGESQRVRLLGPGLALIGEIQVLDPVSEMEVEDIEAVLGSTAGSTRIVTLRAGRGAEAGEYQLKTVPRFGNNSHTLDFTLTVEGGEAGIALPRVQPSSIELPATGGRQSFSMLGNGLALFRQIRLVPEDGVASTDGVIIGMGRTQSTRRNASIRTNGAEGGRYKVELVDFRGDAHELDMEVVILAANEPPTIQEVDLPAEIVKGEEELLVSVVTSDREGLDRVEIQYLSDDSGAETTQRVVMTGKKAAREMLALDNPTVGTQTVRITVFDQGGEESSTEREVRVLSANQPPVLENLELPSSISVGETAIVRVTVDRPPLDGDAHGEIRLNSRHLSTTATTFVVPRGSTTTEFEITAESADATSVEGEVVVTLNGSRLYESVTVLSATPDGVPVTVDVGTFQVRIVATDDAPFEPIIVPVGTFTVVIQQQHRPEPWNPIVVDVGRFEVVIRPIGN